MIASDRPRSNISGPNPFPGILVTESASGSSERGDVNKQAHHALLAEAGNLLHQWAVVVGRAVNDGDGATGNTDEFIILVADFDIPDVGGAATMNGCCHTCQLTLTFGPQVVGIDLQTKGHLFSGIDVEYSTQRCDRLRQHNGDTAVEIANLLAMIRANRHSRHHFIL